MIVEVFIAQGDAQDALGQHGSLGMNGIEGVAIGMTNTRLEHGKEKQSVIGRRGFLRWMGLVAVGSVVSRLGAASEELASSKPNIIVILTDDQGWADVGAQGRSVTSGRRSLTGSPPAGYDAPPGTSPRRSAARRVPFVVS